MGDPLIISCNFLAAIDDMGNTFENLETMLRHAIRSMDSEITSVAAQAAKTCAGEIQLLCKILEEEQKIDRWQVWLTCAAEAGDDHLVRKALKRKQMCKDSLALMRDQLVAAQNVSLALRREIDEIKSQKEVAMSRLDLLVTLNSNR